MSRKLGVMAIALMSTLLMACAGPSAASSSSKPTSSTQAVDIKALDTLKFDPATVTVKSGTPVRLTIVNNGALEHDWVVDNLDGNKLSVDAKPKTNATAEFTPTAPGTYEFYCSIPGHREAGMKGTLTVK
jgi:plastocyanin